MANIKHYSNCGTCNQVWAMAHMVVVGADLHCKACATKKVA